MFLFGKEYYFAILLYKSYTRHAITWLPRWYHVENNVTRIPLSHNVVSTWCVCWELARELATQIALPTETLASVPSRSAVGHKTVSRTRRPRRQKGVTNSSGGPESVCRIPMEMSSVQALMDLSLPRFAGLTDGLHQIHPPWSIVSDSPASPPMARLDTSGEEDSRCSVDQMSVSSACLNLDLFSSSSQRMHLSHVVYIHSIHI